MESADNKTGQPVPDNPTPSSPDTPEVEATAQTTDSSSAYTYYDDYGYEQNAIEPAPPPQPVAGAAPPPPPDPPKGEPEEEDTDDDGMLRMSFLEHLEELRGRLLKALLGIGVAFVLSLYFTHDLWEIISAPATRALELNGVKDPRLAVLTPTEAFSVIWIKLPILTAIFLSSPWVLYQVWAFIAPGLYKRERRWAIPFVLSTAGLFILGGLFAYFVAFRFGLAFLLGIAVSGNLQTVVSITEYFDLFINVTLGLGIVFELPVLIFFLALLRIVTPQFLIRNSRYAILIIVMIAAIITPTPDVYNLMLISLPMTALFFVGVFAAYLLWLSREEKRFPWGLLLLIIVGIVLMAGGTLWVATAKYGFKLVESWPYLVR
jgi:sec-independent protein translocase protein TatC